MLERLAIVDYPTHPEKPNDETRWVKWFHHYVLMPDNKKYEWGYIHTLEAVAIVAAEKSKIALVTQYRYPLGNNLTEVPKGFVERGESNLSAAQRELKEEIRRTGNDWQYLGKSVAAPGIGEIVHHVFLVRELSDLRDTTVADEQEKIQKVEWVELKEFFERVSQNEIIDSVTITAIVMAKSIIGGKQ